MGKVDDITLELLPRQFDELDADGSGELDDEDIEMLTKRIGILKSASSASGAGASGGGSGIGQASRRSLGGFKVAGQR